MNNDPDAPKGFYTEACAIIDRMESWDDGRTAVVLPVRLQRGRAPRVAASRGAAGAPGGAKW
jgi:hypothetical protein